MNASPALLLLGGMVCDERVWGPQRDGLAGDFRDIVVADLTLLPDCGLLATLEAPNAVNDLLRRLSRESTKEPA